MIIILRLTVLLLPAVNACSQAAATVWRKMISSREALKNPDITSSVYINVFKVAHKTVSGWMNKGSSAETGALSAI